MVALEALRMLSDERQEEVSAEEVSAASAVLPHMGEGQPLSVRVSANMALFTLVCRHGFAVCNVDDVRDGMRDASNLGLRVLVEEVSASGVVRAGTLDLAVSAGCLIAMLYECVSKSSLVDRASLGKGVV